MRCSTSSPADVQSKANYRLKILGAAFLVPYTLAAPAAWGDNTGITWELGASSQYFYYEETLPDGTIFNTEKGWLPGLYLSASARLPAGLQLNASISRAKGSVDYEGATQTGRALITNTTETLTRVNVELASPLPAFSPGSLSLIAGVSHTRWNRKIQPTPSTSHLYEHYRWYEFAGGLRHCTTLATLPGIKQVCLTAKLTRSEYGTMTVKLEQFNLGSPELDLGGEWGGEASMKLELEGPFTVRLYTKTWNHGASKPVFIKQPNQVTRLTEPASQSWLTGFEVGLRF